MTKKNRVVHKLARLIPTIRRLHDSAIESNIQLDQYVQENEKLRSFMENEADRYSDLHKEQAKLRQEVLDFKVTKDNLANERQLSSTLEDKVKSLEVTLNRDADIRRLQSDLSSEYIEMNNELSEKAANSYTLKKKLRKRKKKYALNVEALQEAIKSEKTQKKEALANVENLTTELSHYQNLLSEKSVSFDEQLNRSVELEENLKNAQSQIGNLTTDLTTQKSLFLEKNTSLEEQLNRSVELEQELKNAKSQAEILATDLNKQKSLFLEKNITLDEQLNHSVKLERELTSARFQIEHLTTDLITHQNLLLEKNTSLEEQLNRSLALENELVKKADVIVSLNQKNNQIEVQNQERLSQLREMENLALESKQTHNQLIEEKKQSNRANEELLGRLLHLEDIIAQKQLKTDEVSKSLQITETNLQEQLNRSFELEETVKDKNLEVQELSTQLRYAKDQHQEQIERSLSLEKDIQSLNEEKNLLISQQATFNEKQPEVETLQAEIEKLVKEISIKNEQLNVIEHQLNDSQHYATVRSEEALARILGKLSQIDYKDSLVPLTNGTVPLTNYSTQEVVLGKYFELLIGTLTGTLTEDESISPWSKGEYDPVVRSIGRDWPATACSMIGTVRMTSLQRLVCDVIDNDIPGDAIETGVWRGGACILIKSIFDIYGCPDRKVWVADSFEGLPKPDADTYEADVNDDHHTYEPLKVSKEQVEDNFRRFGVLDGNVKFLKGWFKDTLHKAPIKKLAILRLDGDMEESTIQALNALYHKVSKGGYVIIDDYGLGPCRKAVDDFRTKHGIESPIFEVDAACVYWQVK